MDATIDNVLGTLRTALIDFFAGAENTIDRAEKFFADKISRAVTALMAAYYEKLDTELLADKKGRRKAGLVVERKNCKRELLTTLGYLEYKRTYYKKTADGCYAFPIDAIAGIEHYQRLSDCVSQNLVDAAKEMSYARSSNTVTAVSVYEGTDHIGKRGVCRNCWHRASYDQKPDDFWEDTLNEIERRYDLTGTKIYLHGDGAAWIKKGLEWLPNSVFVLDRFHKNKALKNAISGIEQKIGKQYERVFRMA